MKHLHQPRLAFAALLAAAAIGVAGCAQTPGPSSFTPEEAMSLGRVTPATVLEVRQVKIQPNAQTVSAGSLAGAVIGGVAGSSFGGGHGQTLLALGGAILGSIVGQNVQNAAATRQALQVIFKTDDGRTLSIVQPLGANLHAGQKVWITTSGSRYRVIPRTPGTAPAQ